MMKSVLRIGLLTILVLSVYILMFNKKSDDISSSTFYEHTFFPKRISPLDEPQHIDMSVGSFDSPYDRSDFEYFRLKDPSTNQIPRGIKQKELLFEKGITRNNKITFRDARGRPQALDVTFSSRGPINVGGRTRALALDIADPEYNTILAGGVSGGMYRSTDRGKTWVETTLPDQLPSVVSIVQDTRQDQQNVWYYGTGEITGNSASAGNAGAIFRGDGIYQSIDSGKTWQVIPNTQDGDITNNDNPFRFVNRMVIDTTNKVEREMYAAVIDGIIRTTNDFETWEYVLGDDENTSLHTEVAITTEGKLYATISNDFGTSSVNPGIWTSDNGTDWTEITIPNGVSDSRFQRTSIGISPSNEDIVYFFRTELEGQSFTMMVYDNTTGEPTVLPQSSIPSDYSSQGSYNQYITVHPSSSDIVFLGGVDLYRSTNGFADASTTQQIGGTSITNEAPFIYISHHPDQHELVFFPNDPLKAISSNDGGVAITNDILKTSTTEDSFFDPFFDDTVTDDVIVDWDEINTGYITGQFYTVDINKYDALFPWIVGGLQDNSTAISDTDAAEEEWGILFSGDGAFTQLTHNSLIASAQFAQAVRFSLINDDGTETGTIRPPGAGDREEYLFIAPIHADLTIPNKVFIAGIGTLWLTYDVTANPSGDDWIAVGSGVLKDDEIVTSISSSVEPAHQLFIGTIEQNTGISHIYKLMDSNQSTDLVEVNTNGLPDGYINHIEIDPSNANSISIVYANYGIISIYHTEDGGATWVPVAGNLEENEDGSGSGMSVRWMKAVPNGNSNIYLAGTSTGLFYTESFDGMQTVWNKLAQETIGSNVVDMIAYRSIDGFSAVATHGNGVFETYLNTPLKPTIYLEAFPCVNRELVIRASSLAVNSSEYDLDYEWIVDNQSVDGLNGPGIVLPSLEQSFEVQVRVTNTVDGESALSNKLQVDPIDNQYCRTILSVEPERKQDAIAVYPNPVGNTLNLTGQIGQGSSFKIYSIAGRELLSGEISDDSIDVHSLSAGTYVLSILDGEEKTTLRFIKD